MTSEDFSLPFGRHARLIDGYAIFTGNVEEEKLLKIVLI